MKKALILLAAAAFLFASCTKDNAEKNKITFGNNTADVTIGYCAKMAMSHQVGGPGYGIDADFLINGEACHIFFHIGASAKDKKVDLGKYEAAYAYLLEINSSYESGYPFDIHQYNTEYSGGEIGHSSAGTWFKSGTMELKDNGKELILNINGVLQDNRNFKLNITSAYEDIKE